MAASFGWLFLSFFHCCLFISLSAQHTSSVQPNALVFPVTKDVSTSIPQYVTQIKQRTPLVLVKLTVDLSGSWPWVDCEKTYVSSTYKLPPCNSPQCSLLYVTTCGGDSCGGYPENTITSNRTFGDLASKTYKSQHAFILHKAQPVLSTPLQFKASSLASMAASFGWLFLSFFHCCLFISLSAQHTSSVQPNALVFPVTKDVSTSIPQYVTQIKQRTPLVLVKLTVDLSGSWPWVDCEKTYVSSTYKLPPCNSPQCSLLYVTTCGGDSCGGYPENTITSNRTFGDLSQDVVSVHSTNGFNPGKMVTTPKFTFLCGSKTLLKGLPRGVTGMAALGRSDMSLPSQFASIFTSLPRKFAICLSSSTSDKGVIFFGSSPYHFLPNIDISKTLTYTPLITNPVSTAPGEPSFEYFIEVNSIKIGGKKVALNKTLLSINKQGFGGTKISTVNPYTVMETSIYKAVSEAFIQALGRGIPKVTPIPPFSTCFATKDIGFSRMGPGVPTIELVLQNEKVVWNIIGANLMVQAGSGVICLGLVDAGLNPNASLVGFVSGSSHPRTSITIGAHQLENNLLQFDLAMSSLGFSNSLFFQQTNCANFNFTPNA